MLVKIKSPATVTSFAALNVIAVPPEPNIALPVTVKPPLTSTLAQLKVNAVAVDDIISLPVTVKSPATATFPVLPIANEVTYVPVV